MIVVTDLECKTCPKCRVLKPYADFDKNSARIDGLQTYCKTCRPVYRRERKAANPAAYRAAARRHNLTHCFGMTATEYDALFTSQGGTCAICKQPETIPESALSVDHDHTTGMCRGLLCRRCNSCVGYLEGPYGAAALAYLAHWGVQ